MLNEFKESLLSSRSFGSIAKLKFGLSSNIASPQQPFSDDYLLPAPTFKLGATFEEYTHKDFLSAEIEISETNTDKIASLKFDFETVNTAPEISVWYNTIKGKNLCVQLTFFDGRAYWLNPMQVVVSYNSGPTTSDKPHVSLEFRLVKFIDFNLVVSFQQNIIKSTAVDCTDTNNIKLNVYTHTAREQLEYALTENPLDTINDVSFVGFPNSSIPTGISWQFTGVGNNTQKYLLVKPISQTLIYDKILVPVACEIEIIEITSYEEETIIKPNDLSEIGITDAEII